MASCCEHGITVTVKPNGKHAVVTLSATKNIGEQKFEEAVHGVANGLRGSIQEFTATSRTKFAQMKVRLRKISRILRDAQRALVRSLTRQAARRRSQNRRRLRPPKTHRTAPVHFAGGHI